MSFFSPFFQTLVLVYELGNSCTWRHQSTPWVRHVTLYRCADTGQRRWQPFGGARWTVDGRTVSSARPWRRRREDAGATRRQDLAEAVSDGVYRVQRVLLDCLHTALPARRRQDQGVMTSPARSSMTSLLIVLILALCDDAAYTLYSRGRRRNCKATCTLHTRRYFKPTL